MVSESTHNLLVANWDKFHSTNMKYSEDDGIPPQVFNLIEKYREKARSMKPTNDLGMLIDAFFVEVNEHLKDA